MVNLCDLCGLPAPFPLLNDSGAQFCCPACREVSALLGKEPRANDRESAGVLESVTLSLAGMWCTSCGWLIGERLQRARGVASAGVNFLRREAHVTFDPSRTEPRALSREVRRAGYRAWLPGDQPYDEEDALQTRLLATGVLVMHVMMVSIFLYVRDAFGWSSPDTEWLAGFFHVMAFVASLPVMLVLGLPILRAGLAGLLRLRPNTHTLIALGAFSAYGLSVRNLWAGMDVYFDTAAVLLFLLGLGRWLELRAQKAGARAVERLWERMPPEASLVSADGETRVPAGQVAPGSRVRVRPGERFPVDGVVATGEGDVDESLLTGEPEPVARRAGACVMAGTLNLDGFFDVVTSAVGGETVAGQIGRLLHQALWQRAPVERLADRAAALMLPVALLLSGVTFAYWFRSAGVETALIYSLSVLLIACPCALGIATPLTLSIALERAAGSGVILRHTGVLERLARVRRIAFDKTGTLTQRPLRLREVAAGGGSELSFLKWVAAVESASEHPLGRAVAAAFEGELPAVTAFRALPGKGVTGVVEGCAIWVGSRALMDSIGLEMPAPLRDVTERWQLAGWRSVHAGWDGRVRGMLAFAEAVRPEAAEAIARARALGLEVAVLTGDSLASGRRWSDTLGVPVVAAQSPADKVEGVRGIPDTAMVGDGINDGPALAAASVGLAVGHATDVAQAAAEAILIQDDLRAVPWLVSLARVTLRTVRLNLLWAFSYNLVGLTLAVTGHLQPVMAALAMVLSSLVVTSNALRLRQADLDGVTAPALPSGDAPVRMPGHEIGIHG